FNYDFNVSVRDLDAGASQPEMERPSPRRTDLPAYNFTKKPFGAENPGLSAFALGDGIVYHTYSCYARGLDIFNSTYQLLDRAGNAGSGDGIGGFHRHDEYEPAVASTAGA